MFPRNEEYLNKIYAAVYLTEASQCLDTMLALIQQKG